MPIRHDLECAKCKKRLENAIINAIDLKDSKVTTLKCPQCGKKEMYISWTSGEAPKGFMKQETLGDIWSKKDVNPGTTQYEKRVTEVIKKNKKSRNAKPKNL